MLFKEVIVWLHYYLWFFYKKANKYFKATNEKYEISDEGIKDILSDVPSEKISEVAEKWNNSHLDGNLTDSQLDEICRGVQEVQHLK